MTELEKLCKVEGIKCSSVYLGFTSDNGWHGNTYKVTLRYGRKRLTTPFRQGLAHKGFPMVADVMYCLIGDAECGLDDFEDFCSNLGLDTDFRKAEKDWKTCKRTHKRLTRFLGEKFDDFSEAAKDH